MKLCIYVMFIPVRVRLNTYILQYTFRNILFQASCSMRVVQHSYELIEVCEQMCRKEYKQVRGIIQNVCKINLVALSSLTTTIAETITHTLIQGLCNRHNRQPKNQHSTHVRILNIQDWHLIRKFVVFALRLFGENHVFVNSCRYLSLSSPSAHIHPTTDGGQGVCKPYCTTLDQSGLGLLPLRNKCCIIYYYILFSLN